MRRTWFARRSHTKTPRCRPAADTFTRGNPFHHLLRLEPLEDRRLLTAFLVNSLSDAVAADGAITLREALEAANTNAAVYDAPAGSPTETDQITFAPSLFTDGTNPVPGTITLSGTQLTIADEVDIVGPGAELLSINANDLSRAFYVNGSVAASLSQMTITNGKADDGGGVYNGGTLTIVNATISSNTATDDGGGIFSYGSSSSLTITNSAVSDNSAAHDGSGVYSDGSSSQLTITHSTVSGNLCTGSYGDGGGIYMYSSSGAATISDSTISGNCAENGGGVYSDSSLTVTNSTISDNTSTGDHGYGGGICNEGTLVITGSTISDNTSTGDRGYGGGICNEGTLVITGSTISDNTSTGDYGYGGGICNEDTLTLLNSTIAGNSATSYGGGVCNSSGTLTLINSTIAGNSATSYGGGVCNSSGTLTLINSTIAGNSATSYGGGVYNSSGALAVANSTVWGNSASRGGGVYGSSGTFALSNSIVALNLAATDPDVRGVLASGSGCNLFGIDPLFVRNPSPGADAMWGTADDDYGDLHLTDHSPAIDMGSDAAVPAGVTTDRDGNPRIVGGCVDIGAYEFQGTLPAGRETASTTVTTADDTVDLYDGAISLREALLYAGLGVLGTVITFEPALDGGTITLDGRSLYIDRAVKIDVSSFVSLAIDGAGGSRVLTVFSSEGVQLVAVTIHGGSGTDGGGVYNWGELTITDCVFSGNSGGAIYNAGTLTVLDSIIVGNTASCGGAISSSSGTLTVVGSTIAGNSAASCGGIYGSGGAIVLANSIVALNSASSDPDLCGSLAIGSGHNLIGIDPRFVRNPSRGPDNTWGTADDDYGDLRLIDHSAGIDMGNDDAVPGYLTTDLDGNPRIAGERVDVGAYEFQGMLPAGREAASTIVTTAGDTVDLYDGAVSLREALCYAGRDTLATNITFESALDGGTVILNGQSLYVDRPLRIDASSLGSLTLDAAGQSRVLTILTSNEVDLVALTIRGGSAPSGGGVYSCGALTIAHSTISGNVGGGVYSSSGTLTVTNSTISGNLSLTSGGGIYSHRGAVTLRDSTVSGNSSGSSGGGIYIGDSFQRGSSRLTVTNSTISENSASNGGGVCIEVYFYDGFSITDSTISGNVAIAQGGGVFDSGGTVTITNSTISDNQANAQGGGILNVYGRLIITNSTIIANATTGSGGGLYNSPDSSWYWQAAVLHNSVIAANTASGNSQVFGAVSSASSHNLIGVSTGLTGITNGINGNQIGVAAPLDPKLGPLADNGGPTLTNAPLPGSPLINAGSDAKAVDSKGAPLVTDQRGYARRFGTADIGAVETQPPGLPVAHDDVASNNMGQSITVDVLANDFCSDGSPMEARIVTAPSHGTLAENQDGTLTYTPEATFWGTDSFSYQAVNGEWVSNTADVVFSVVSPTSIIVTTAVDEADGDLTPDDISLREALAMAPPGSTIQFSTTLFNQTITLAAGTLRVSGATIVGLGASHLTIDGALASIALEAVGADSLITCLRVAGGTDLRIWVDSGAVLSIQDVVVFGNSIYDNGSGIYNLGTLTVMNSTISGNSVYSRNGGAIYNDRGCTLTITNSIIVGNTASSGGAICNSYSGTLILIDSIIAGNSAWHGGGILSSGTTTITNSTISGNSADEGGGGILSGGTTTITNSTISGNSATHFGGGIWGSVRVTDSTIAGNSASTGGAIYNNSYRDVTVTNSTISGNSATTAGGIFNASGWVYVANSNICGNSASDCGGGIYNGFDGTLRVTNSNFCGNSASNSGGGIYNRIDGTLRVTNSIVALNTASSFPDVYGSSAAGSGFNLIGVEPLFVRNPSPGDSGDLHLLPGSPAINMGSNALAVDAEGDPLARDLDGRPRIIYSAVDIGAYEFGVVGDADGDYIVDSRDASILGANWRQQAGATWADGDFNRDGKVDDRDAAILAAHWGERLVPLLPGDANDDGTVDGADASILGAHWRQQSGATWAMGDFNDDGKVDDRDAAILAAHWGEQIEAAALAEGGGTAATDRPSRGVVGPTVAPASPGARRVIEPRVIEPRAVEVAGAATRAARDAAMADGLGDEELLACRLAWAHGSVGPRERAARRGPITAPPVTMLPM